MDFKDENELDVEGCYKLKRKIAIKLKSALLFQFNKCSNSFNITSTLLPGENVSNCYCQLLMGLVLSLRIHVVSVSGEASQVFFSFLIDLFSLYNLILVWKTYWPLHFSLCHRCYGLSAAMVKLKNKIKENVKCRELSVPELVLSLTWDENHLKLMLVD